MKKILVALAVFGSFLGFSQDYELRVTPYVNCKIIYADGTSEEGLLRLASSAYKPQFKKDENDTSRKIDYELVDRIISNPNTENERVFQYVNHNYSKFKLFAELIYEDVFQIYISLTDSDELFYLDFDRRSMGERMAQARFEGNSEFTERLKTSDTLTLPNGKEMVLPMRYTYYYGVNYGVAFGTAPRLNYYLSKVGDDKMYRVEKNKRFLKKAKELINDCPHMINVLEQDELRVSELPKFIEYYKDACNDVDDSKD